MNKTKIISLFGTSNMIHDDVRSIQSLPQKSASTKCPSSLNTNCTNSKREVNKRRHIVLSLLIAITTILMVACPEPTEDKGSTAPPPTLSKLLGRLANAVDMAEGNTEEKKAKQKKIQNLLKKIKATDSNNKLKPKTKDELVVFIRAEIWRQGTNGDENWKADLNEIDTTSVTDMRGLFAVENNLDKWKGAIPVWTMPEDRGDIFTHKNTLSRIQTILKTKDATKKQKDLKELLAFIDLPDHKHKPKTKDELVFLIRAEIWAQGTGGTPNWEADLNEIDTSLITDMSFLFSNNQDKGYGLHEYNGLPAMWVLKKPTNAQEMYTGSKAPLPTWYSIEKIKQKIDQRQDEDVKQDDIKELIKSITKDNPDYKHKPETKDELVFLIRAEIWAQGTGGNPNWEANLNNIDTSSVTDMRDLFTVENKLDKWKGAIPVWTMPEDRGDIFTHKNTLSRIQTILKTKDATKKQKDLKELLAFIASPDHKHKPKTKDELVVFIRAEIWAQGTNGDENWKADLNEIDTTSVTDMSFLFSNNQDKGYGLHEYNGLPAMWVLKKPTNAQEMYTGSKAPLPTWYSIEKIKQEIDKRKDEDVKQDVIKELIKSITKDNPDYKHKPETKDELVFLIRAEIWAQGTGGTPNWKADLNNIDTSLITDMSFLFSNNQDKGYGLHEYNGLPAMWVLKKPTNAQEMYTGSKAPLPTWYSIEKIKQKIDQRQDEDVKQDDIKELIKSITKDNPDYKHKPETKDELVFLIRAEIWAQGTGGNPNWEANLNNIDTSLITDMSFLFGDTSALFGQPLNLDLFNRYGFRLASFKGDISAWDVRSVKNMSFMFAGALAFNQDIGDWKVRRVTNMSFMFSGAKAFNQDISTWDVRSVTNMSFMFSGAKAFNQDISAWDVRSVTNMEAMFGRTEAFNQDISTWDVRSVTNMSFMFDKARAFNQDIGNWDVSSVKNMEAMFAVTEAFNQDISTWDVRSVTDMESMFDFARAFNQDIGAWNVRNVKNMKHMFRYTAFNQDIGNWDVRSVTNMEAMFGMTEAFNQDIGAWDVSSVKNMSWMFSDAVAFNQDIGTWDVSSVTNMSVMFAGAGAFNQNLNNWDKHLKNTDGSYRRVHTDGMFDSSGLENNLPTWFANIPK